jgi:hypothetical protein
MVAEKLRALAARYRALATRTADPQALVALEEAAEQCEALAIAVGLKRPASAALATGALPSPASAE